MFVRIVKHRGDGNNPAIDDVFIPPVRHRISCAAPTTALAKADGCPCGVDVGWRLLSPNQRLDRFGGPSTRGPLSVISNSLPVINKMSKEPGIDLIALGGAYYPAYDAFLGMRTGDAIRSLRANVVFMSPTAVTNGQCYHQSQETVAVKRAMMESADRTVLLLDHTKFRKSGVYQLAALTDFDLVIVDDDTPEAEVAALRAQGVHLHVASSKTDQQSLTWSTTATA